MLNPRHVIDNIADNVRKTRNPFGLGKSALTGWARGLELPAQGEYLLFTGGMYQLVPYIKATTGYLAQAEDTPRADYLRYGTMVPKFLASMALGRMADRADQRQAAGTLANVVRLLRVSRVNFGYRPDLDEYSGVLLYDLGDQPSFEAHARLVAGRLRDAGIRRLITVDPHTTHALKVLYPKYTGISFEVRGYFELLDLPRGTAEDQEVTLHDPCLFGRYLQLSELPRKILLDQGIRCSDLTNSRTFTSCCGGPAESISPKLADEVGQRRAAELTAAGRAVVTMCPICHVNLQRAGAEAEDLANLLARSLS